MRQRLLITAVLAMALSGWYAAYRTVRFTITVASELARADSQTSLRPRAQSTLVMDRFGQPAFSFYSEQRIDIPIGQVSRYMLEAIVAVEDRRFYSHYGLDPIRIVGAALRNVKAGKVREGGSTITQQLARAGRLSPARTFERKLRESMLALQLETRYSKARILQEYLNTVYFGEGFYGVEAASRGYFAKPASELAPGEAALLAALVRAPAHDAPCVSIERARQRRNLVLRLMRNQGRITDLELAAGLRSPLPSSAHGHASLLRADSEGDGGYFQEQIRQQLVAMFGSERVLRGGLRVYSTYDPRAAASRRTGDTRPRGRDRQDASRREGPAGQPGRDRSRHRRCRGARRRPELRREPFQPRHAGQTAGRIRLQTDHLCGGARARVRARNGTPRSRRTDRGRRRAVASGRRAREQPVHAAAGPERVEQSCRRATAPGRGRRHRRHLCPSPRDRLGAAERSVARARHRRSDVARAHRGIRGLCQSGPARRAALPDTRRGRRWHGHLVRAVTRRRAPSVRPRPS